MGKGRSRSLNVENSRKDLEGMEGGWPKDEDDRSRSRRIKESNDQRG
jgi:hypothetical protein